PAGGGYRDGPSLLGSRSAAVTSSRRGARSAGTTFAKRVAGNPLVLGISVGNELPAAVIRWVGTKPVSTMLSELCALVRDIDPQMLVTYANYPTAEYLRGDDSDFITFNVFLESRPA